MLKMIISIICLGLSLGIFSQAPEGAQLQKLALIPEHPAPGSLFRIHAVSDPQVEMVIAVLKTVNGAKLAEFRGHYYKIGAIRHWVIVGVIPVARTDKPFLIVLRSPNQPNIPETSFTLITSEHAFHSETIAFDDTMSKLKTEPDPQKIRESNVLYGVLTRFDERIPTGIQGFIFPLENLRNTAYFGDRRIYAYANGGTESTLHFGMDYGGDRMSVYAPAFGWVVLARKRIVTGNTLVIQHAPGLFSLYYHLSTLNVTEGQTVFQSSLLGTSGSTGLVTGPHLHWEFRNQGEPVNPEALVAHEHIDTIGLSQVLLLPLLP